MRTPGPGWLERRRRWGVGGRRPAACSGLGLLGLWWGGVCAAADMSGWGGPGCLHCGVAGVAARRVEGWGLQGREGARRDCGNEDQAPIYCYLKPRRRTSYARCTAAKPTPCCGWVCVVVGGLGGLE